MKQKRKFIDYFDSVFEKNKNDELIVYKKNSFYPCIQINVITVERSRDDMGILEMTILKLIKLGISDIIQIAKLTGFNKADKLNALINEMIGYGMIELKNNKLFISEIGNESITCGHQMIATHASLLLCGITGKLLPKAMYGAKRVEVDELSSCIGFKYLIDEKPIISLESLNLKGIDKRKYNIKDEVDYISEYLDYTQVFLEADISIYNIPAKNYFSILVGSNKTQKNPLLLKEYKGSPVFKLNKISKTAAFTNDVLANTYEYGIDSDESICNIECTKARGNFFIGDTIIATINENKYTAIVQPNLTFTFNDVKKADTINEIWFSMHVEPSETINHSYVSSQQITHIDEVNVDFIVYNSAYLSTEPCKTYTITAISSYFLEKDAVAVKINGVQYITTVGKNRVCQFYNVAYKDLESHTNNHLWLFEPDSSIEETELILEYEVMETESGGNGNIFIKGSINTDNMTTGDLVVLTINGQRHTTCVDKNGCYSVIAMAKEDQNGIEIAINKEKVDWTIDSKQLLSEISMDTTKLSDLVFNFKTYFGEFGFNDIQVKDKEFNCVEIECSSILTKTLKIDFNGHPLLAYIGSFSNPSKRFEYMPIPINRLPFKKFRNEKLKIDEDFDNFKKLIRLVQGQMIYLTTASKDILTKALIYRKLYEIRYDFYKIPYDERDKKFNEYFNENVELLEFDKPLIQDVINNYLSQRYKKIIHKGDDE